MRRTWAILLALLPPALALAQGEVRIVYPPDGATVREVVTVKVEKPNPDQGYVTLRIDGKFVAAIAADRETGLFLYRWDTKKVKDGEHEIEAVAIGAGGEVEGRAKVRVKVENKLAPPEALEGLKLRESFRTGDRDTYRLKVEVEFDTPGNPDARSQVEPWGGKVLMRILRWVLYPLPDGERAKVRDIVKSVKSTLKPLGAAGGMGVPGMGPMGGMPGMMGPMGPMGMMEGLGGRQELQGQQPGPSMPGMMGPMMGPMGPMGMGGEMMPGMMGPAGMGAQPKEVEVAFEGKRTTYFDYVEGKVVGFIEEVRARWTQPLQIQTAAPQAGAGAPGGIGPIGPGAPGTGMMPGMPGMMMPGYMPPGMMPGMPQGGMPGYMPPGYMPPGGAGGGRQGMTGLDGRGQELQGQPSQPPMTPGMPGMMMPGMPMGSMPMGPMGPMGPMMGSMPSGAPESMPGMMPGMPGTTTQVQEIEVVCKIRTEFMMEQAAE